MVETSREGPRPENQTMISIIRDYDWTLSTYVQYSNLHTANVQCWIKINALGAIGEIITSREKADQDWTKVMVQHKLCWSVARGILYIVSGLLLKLIRISARCEAKRSHWKDDSTQLADNVFVFQRALSINYHDMSFINEWAYHIHQCNILLIAWLLRAIIIRGLIQYKYATLPK